MNALFVELNGLIEVEYDCGCKYFHWGGSGVRLSHACDEHRMKIINDRLKEFA